MKRLLIPLLILSIAGSAAVDLAGAREALASVKASETGPPVRTDVIAHVGDQSITFGEINTAMNSSAVVGVSVPALGTPERDTVRIMLLDRFISANLLYLDARKQGLDKDPVYRREVERFDNAILAGLYYQRLLIDEAGAVSEEDVQAYFKKRNGDAKELTADLRAAVEAKLRRDKISTQRAQIKDRIRDDVEVILDDDNLSSAGDASRADDVPIAEIDGEPVTWGSVKERIIAAGEGALRSDPFADDEEARRQALEQEIDLRISVNKARAAGLDEDPLFKARSQEFHKTRLINLHRERLLAGLEPNDTELKRYYDANRTRILQPEARKVQMVVVETKDQAEQIKAEIEAGIVTMYQAAQQHSIAPKAKEDLGEIGWVSQGEALPALDQAIFALGPSEISAPVQTPAGWHLVTVQDMQEAKHTDFYEPGTRKLTRREYLNDKLNAYTADLRRNHVTVEVNQDLLVRLAQQEADMVKALAEKAAQPGSVTQQRVKELSKLLRP